MTAQPGLAQDALQLYPYGNSWRQRVNVSLTLGQFSRSKRIAFHILIARPSRH